MMQKKIKIKIRQLINYEISGQINRPLLICVKRAFLSKNKTKIFTNSTKKTFKQWVDTLVKRFLFFQYFFLEFLNLLFLSLFFYYFLVFRGRRGGLIIKVGKDWIDQTHLRKKSGQIYFKILSLFNPFLPFKLWINFEYPIYIISSYLPYPGCSQVQPLKNLFHTCYIRAGWEL